MHIVHFIPYLTKQATGKIVEDSLTVKLLDDQHYQCHREMMMIFKLTLNQKNQDDDVNFQQLSSGCSRLVDRRVAITPNAPNVQTTRIVGRST